MSLSSLFSTATGFLGGIQTYLIVGAATAVIAGSVGAYGGYRFELGTYETRVAADAEAQTAAVTKAGKVASAEASVALAAGIKEGQAQAKIEVQTVTIKQKVPVYVHDQIRCPGPTVGLARVLRAAAAGADPSTLQLAAGQSDDDCSDVTASDVAGWFTDYAGASQANAQQLNDLEAWITADHTAQIEAAK